jgi:hypothetical protein
VREKYVVFTTLLTTTCGKCASIGGVIAVSWRGYVLMVLDILILTTRQTTLCMDVTDVVDPPLLRLQTVEQP